MSEANDNPGLLASAEVEEPQTTEGQEQSAISHVDTPEKEDDSPLERPDFWPEKFWIKDKAEPDLEGISKSYMELEKQFRSGKHKPPEGGNYDLASLGETPQDDPLAKTYVAWAQLGAGITAAAVRVTQMDGSSQAVTPALAQAILTAAVTNQDLWRTRIRQAKAAYQAAPTTWKMSDANWPAVYVPA
jgi:hypothetical protein